METGRNSISQASHLLIEACTEIQLRQNLFSASVRELATYIKNAVVNAQKSNSPSKLPELNSEIRSLLDATEASHSTDEQERKIIVEVVAKLFDAFKYTVPEGFLKEKEATVSIEELAAFRKIFELQSNQLNKKLAELKTQVNTIESDFEEKKNSVSSAADAAHTEMEKLLKDFRRAASESSNELIYKSYKESARTEQLLSNKFRNYSVAMMLTATTIAIYTIINSLESLTIEQTIYRLVASALLSIPAAYFARESSKHRSQQYIYQQLHLTLDALPGFISELETNNKAALKA